MPVARHQQIHGIISTEAPTATAATLDTIGLNDGSFIPPIGLGTWTMSNKDAQRAVEIALDVGYRLIDTAASYANEEGVGQAIRASGVPRGEIVVTTKLEGADHGYEPTLRAFDASAKRLGLDMIDLYLIHWPLPEQDRYVGSWKAMVDLKQQGRVRSIGVSNFDAQQIEYITDATGVGPVINQIELNPEHQQTRLRAVHDSKRIITEAWSPLGRGSVLADPVIIAIAAKHERTPAQIVLRWCMEHRIVAIPKSSEPRRIRENLEVFDFSLDAGDLAAIARLDRGE
ncbi:MAG TPA: aldo/keto reductase [Gemmatimonadaceae bacterium]